MLRVVFVYYNSRTPSKEGALRFYILSHIGGVDALCNRLEQPVLEGLEAPPTLLTQTNDQLAGEQLREGRDTPDQHARPTSDQLVASGRERPSPPKQVKGTMVRFARPSKKEGPVGCNFVCAMILPQVHLRKPCYDFSFL